MTDYFALLDEARSACVDVDALKQKFHRRARTEHPDAGGTTFEQLSAAYRTLTDPKLRLAHLLELNGAERPAITQPPADLVELFFETGNALNGSRTAIEHHLARLARARDGVVVSLATLDIRDDRQLADAHQRFAFLDRWIAQLEEALV